MSQPLLSRISDGDQLAVKECLDRYGGLVWSMALRLLGDRAEAEDATQEVFIDLWRSADRYRPDLGSEVTFVTVLARRRLIDRKRRSGLATVPTELTELTQAEGERADHAAEVRDEADRARAALCELKPEQRGVLEMSVCQGLTHQEIAEKTGLPLGTVKTHVRRGLLKVREILGCGSAGEVKS